MAQAPKLPKKIEERTDHDVAEYLFGKKATKELERMAGIRPMHRS